MGTPPREVTVIGECLLPFSNFATHKGNNLLSKRANSFLVEKQGRKLTENYLFSSKAWMKYVLYTCNSISVISGQWIGVNGRLCVTEPCLPLKRFLPQACFEP